MNRLIKFSIFLLVGFAGNCFAQVEVFNCQLVGSNHQFQMTIDYTKNEIVYDIHNIQDIKHIDEEYITSYARFGTGGGVGGGVEVFNRKTLVVTSVDIEHANSPEGTDELVTHKYSSQCKK